MSLSAGQRAHNPRQPRKRFGMRRPPKPCARNRHRNNRGEDRGHDKDYGNFAVLGWIWLWKFQFRTLFHFDLDEHVHFYGTHAKARKLPVLVLGFRQWRRCIHRCHTDAERFGGDHSSAVGDSRQQRVRLGLLGWHRWRHQRQPRHRTGGHRHHGQEQGRAGLLSVRIGPEHTLSGADSVSPQTAAKRGAIETRFCVTGTLKGQRAAGLLDSHI